jgi:hypothetical protein
MGLMERTDQVKDWSPEELMIESDNRRYQQSSDSQYLMGDQKEGSNEHCCWTLLPTEILQQPQGVLESPMSNIRNSKLSVSHTPDYLSEISAPKSSTKNKNSQYIPQRCFEWTRDHSKNQMREEELGAYLRTNNCARRQPSILTRQQPLAVKELSRTATDSNFRRLGASIAPLMLKADLKKLNDPSTLLPEAIPNFYGLYYKKL